MCFEGGGSLRTVLSLKIINLTFVVSLYDCLISAFRLPGRAFYSGHQKTFFSNNFSGLGLSCFIISFLLEILTYC